MKKWTLLLATGLVVLGIVASPIAIMAKSEETPTVNKQLKFNGGLALVAPRVAIAGQEMSMTVFDRPRQEPVEDVGIWAATQASVESLKADVKTLKENTAIPEVDKNYEATINLHATLLGRTDKKGKLLHTFNESGKFLLIAFKKGYYPDWSGIAVVGIPRALGIEAPSMSHVGKEVRMQVFQRGTQDPIADAAVWAVSAEKIEEIKNAIQQIKGTTAASAVEADYEPVVKTYAFLLGRTDGNGKLSHTFNQAGKYLLVTLKKGYIPGWTGIAIRELPSTTNTPAK